MVEVAKAQYTYNYNPYAPNGTFFPQSPLMIPQPQVMPNQAQFPIAPPQVITNPIVTANQAVPYINPNSSVFNPMVNTTSGATVASLVTPCILQQDAQVVYQGPVKTVNPQVTPHELADNQIEKDMRKYYENQTKGNKELQNAINSGWPKKATLLGATMKAVAFAGIALGAYKFRNKIPFVNRIFK